MSYNKIIDPISGKKKNLASSRGKGYYSIIYNYKRAALTMISILEK